MLVDHVGQALVEFEIFGQLFLYLLPYLLAMVHLDVRARLVGQYRRSVASRMLALDELGNLARHRLLARIIFGEGKILEDAVHEQTAVSG